MSFLKSCGRRKRGAVSFQSCSLFNFLFENCRKLTTKRSRKLIHLYQSRCLEIIWELEIKMFHVVTSFCCQSVYIHTSLLLFRLYHQIKPIKHGPYQTDGRPSEAISFQNATPGPRPGPRLEKVHQRSHWQSRKSPPNSASSGDIRRRRGFLK